MRIDSNHGPQPPESNRSPQNSPAAGSASASNALGSLIGEDQTQLSGVHVQVEALAAQASQLPEVREERVHALRQAVQSGQYQPVSEQVAGALLAHMIAASAA